MSELPEELPQLSRVETIRSIASGLQPYEGDLFDLFDGASCLWGCLYHWSHLALRIVMMICFPLTIVVLYPFVRRLQKLKLKKDAAEWERRKELIKRLTQKAKP